MREEFDFAFTFMFGACPGAVTLRLRLLLSR
jgi:hypothetical protein